MNTSSYHIHLPQFEGPFDLLLFFIERDELDIYNIPITRIIQDFLGFIRTSEESNIELSSEFILFVSTLMRIKAKMLLPRKELDEHGNEIDPRRELVDKILDTGRFDFDRASQAPGWLKELRGEHVPETEEYGIASSAYRARRPFHPQRFFDFLSQEWRNGRLLRSKGFFWLASKYQEAGSWSQAGGLMRHGLAGRWWRFVAKQHWPQDEEGLQTIMKHWSAEVGDCRQELVFIGQNIDFPQLVRELDDCLLTDEEMAGGPDAWRLLADPFGAWQQEAA